MAVCPSLGVDDVGDTVAGSADGKPVAATLEIVEQRLQLVLVAHQKLDVVPSGETKVAVAILIGNLADVPDEIGTDQSGSPHANRKELGAGFRDMNENARLNDLVILPLPPILLDDGRHEGIVLGRTDIRDAVLQQIIGIECHLFIS